MGLYRECDDAGWREDAGDADKYRREVVDIDKDIGGEHEVIFGAVADFIGKKVCNVTDREPIVKGFRLDGAERKPRGGKTRCDLDGLRQQIGCSNKVAPSGEFDGRLVTAIADKVAGGYKQWAGVGH